MFKKIKHYIKVLDKRVVNRFRIVLVGALTFVCALRWNDAIKSIIESIFPKSTNWIGDIFSAFSVTVIAVIIIFIIEMLLKKKEK